MPQGSVITDEMKRAIGVETAPACYEIEKGHIRRFAEAIGDANPLYTNEARARESRYGGIIAPPTFVRMCAAPASLLDVKAVTGMERTLDGGSDWEYFYPVRPGDVIAVTAKYTEFKERDGRMGKMLIMSVQQTYRNQLGQVVATQTVGRIIY